MRPAPAGRGEGVMGEVVERREPDRAEVRGLIAHVLMMQRRGNPDMGGPSWHDRRNAQRLLEAIEEDYEITVRRRDTQSAGERR